MLATKLKKLIFDEKVRTPPMEINDDVDDDDDNLTVLPTRKTGGR